jgi:hypothetical protein
LYCIFKGNMSTNRRKAFSRGTCPQIEENEQNYVRLEHTRSRSSLTPAKRPKMTSRHWRTYPQNDDVFVIVFVLVRKGQGSWVNPTSAIFLFKRFYRVDCRSRTELITLRFLLNNRPAVWFNLLNFGLGTWLSTGKCSGANSRFPSLGDCRPTFLESQRFVPEIPIPFKYLEPECGAGSGMGHTWMRHIYCPTAN